MCASSFVEAYLTDLRARLVEIRVAVKDNVTIGKYPVPLSGLSPIYDPRPKGLGNQLLDPNEGLHWPMLLYFAVYPAEGASVDLAKDYTQTVFDSFMSMPEPVNLSIRVAFPVMVSEKFEDDVKSYVESYDGAISHILKQKFDLPHPVLIETSDQQVFHNSTVGITGAKGKLTADIVTEDVLAFARPKARITAEGIRFPAFWPL